MARTIKDAKLDSRSARAKLNAPGPVYRSIDVGLHLGYRKGKTGGRWVARRYVGDGRYDYETIGTADDLSDANGVDVLNFFQAQTLARRHAGEAAKVKGAGRGRPLLTVRHVVDEYLDWLATHGKSAADARNRVLNDIYPAFADTEVAGLTTGAIRKWHQKLAERPRRVRGAKGGPARSLAAPSSGEEVRRRRASANRTLTVLKAALNAAFRERKIESDHAWRPVTPFREVDAARVRYLSVAEIARLMNAADTDFRRVVNAALLTGCRYGELARLRVADFNADAGTVHVGRSKSGKPRHVVLTEEGQSFFRQLTAGRSHDAPMLAKGDGSPWGSSHQIRPMAEACERARIRPAVGIHIVRHTYASHLVMAGVPMPVVAANLGHADSRMTEKHYAHLAPSYVAETIRRLAPNFGTVEAGNVEPLRR